MSSNIALTFLIEPNVLANLTSTLGYNRWLIYLCVCIVMIYNIITGNGSPEATLSAKGVVARGEAKSEELFLPKLKAKGDLGNLLLLLLLGVYRMTC